MPTKIIKASSIKLVTETLKLKNFLNIKHRISKPPVDPSPIKVIPQPTPTKIPPKRAIIKRVPVPNASIVDGSTLKLPFIKTIPSFGQSKLKQLSPNPVRSKIAKNIG